MTRSIILSALVIMLSSSAHASEISRGVVCGMKENVQVSINFTGSIDVASKVKSIVAAKTAKVISLAKDSGIVDVELSAQNINLSLSLNNPLYTYNGNSSFKIKSYDKSFELLDKLKADNYQASLSVSRYAHGNCN